MFVLKLSGIQKFNFLNNLQLTTARDPFTFRQRCMPLKYDSLFVLSGVDRLSFCSI